jgi:hypothetical protein
VSIETQLGGANFLGMTINTQLEIPLSADGKHKLTPKIGVGGLMPGWDDPTVIIHTGLNYSFKNWGTGIEVSGFTPNPFRGTFEGSDFVDMIVYPNINYNWKFESQWYLRFSAGAWFAFSRYHNYNTQLNTMEFEGDVIPGIGISFGRSF